HRRKEGKWRVPVSNAFRSFKTYIRTSLRWPLLQWFYLQESESRVYEGVGYHKYYTRKLGSCCRRLAELDDRSAMSMISAVNEQQYRPTLIQVVPRRTAEPNGVADYA